MPGEFKGVSNPWISEDEFAKWSGMHPGEQAKRRGWGDEWDDTSAGVILRPLPNGTLVEFYDNAREQLMLGKVVGRDTGVRVNGSTSYEIDTSGTRHIVGRENISVFDHSPEGIEAFLEPDLPRTAEEIERWLGDA